MRHSAYIRVAAQGGLAWVYCTCGKRLTGRLGGRGFDMLWLDDVIEMHALHLDEQIRIETERLRGQNYGYNHGAQEGASQDR